MPSGKAEEVVVYTAIRTSRKALVGGGIGTRSERGGNAEVGHFVPEDHREQTLPGVGASV